MTRREDAHVSQSSISQLKTIYVEGTLDSKLIRTYLKNKKIYNTRVTEINIEVDDTALPVDEREISKSKIKTIIELCNQQGNSLDVLGVIDLDYDYFNGCKENISNLKYTDLNSIESYFLDLNLINGLIEDYDLPLLDIKTFNKWQNNALLFSSLFYHQLCEIDNLDDTEKIKFKTLSLENDYFVDFQKCRINIKNIVENKTGCENMDTFISKFIVFLKSMNRTEIYSNIHLFLHGKYTFKFIVSLIKRKYKKLKSLSYDTFECVLKDKFILYKVEDYVLFNDIKTFCIT